MSKPLAQKNPSIFHSRKAMRMFTPIFSYFHSLTLFALQKQSELLIIQN